MDSLRNRATETPVVLLHAKESGMKINEKFCFHFCAIKVKMIYSCGVHDLEGIRPSKNLLSWKTYFGKVKQQLFASMILAFRYELSEEILELSRSYRDEELGDTSHVLAEVLCLGMLCSSQIHFSDQIM